MSLALAVVSSGSTATLDFLAKLQVLTPAKADEEHLRVLLDLNPSLDQSSPAATASNLAEMAGALRGAGAEALAVVSNSAHANGDMIQRASGLPLIDMIAAASSAARETGARRVGVLGSKASLRLYREYLAARAMGQVSLPPDRQEQFLVALARLRRGDRSPAMRARISDFTTDLMGLGAEVVIVGSVEAALVLDIGDFQGELIDPTEMLARRCVNVCMGYDPLPAVLT